MEINDRIEFEVIGFYRIRLTNILTGEVEVDITTPPNVFCNKGKDLIFNLFKNKLYFHGINHMAFGTDNTAATAGDTALGAEVSRTDVSLYTHTDGTYNCIYSAFWDANTPDTTYNNIWELGVFGGNSTLTADSGYIVSHVILAGAITKTTGVHTLDVDYTLQFA